MAFSYDDSGGVIYDIDGGFFDGPEIQNIDLDGFGIGTVEGFGLAEFTLYVEAPPSILTQEVFGSPEATLHIKAVGSIGSLEAFGLGEFTLYVEVPSIASLEAFGVPEAILYIEEPTGIVSLEAFGIPEFTFELSATGIESLEAFGEYVFLKQWEGISPVINVWDKANVTSQVWTPEEINTLANWNSESPKQTNWN